jgi:hypothetical protein
MADQLPLSMLEGCRVTAERQAELEAALSRAAEAPEVQGYDYNLSVTPGTDMGGSYVNTAGVVVPVILAEQAIVTAVGMIGGSPGAGSISGTYPINMPH